MSGFTHSAPQDAAADKTAGHKEPSACLLQTHGGFRAPVVQSGGLSSTHQMFRPKPEQDGAEARRVFMDQYLGCLPSFLPFLLPFPPSGLSYSQLAGT